jgi:hypothetical protein
MQETVASARWLGIQQQYQFTPDVTPVYTPAVGREGLPKPSEVEARAKSLNGVFQTYVRRQ